MSPFYWSSGNAGVFYVRGSDGFLITDYVFWTSCGVRQYPFYLYND
ncbi:MAG: hypothetical protein HFI36_01345 [Bacilli bacterium]|nr:hypothetical protein [Bacilli bacterium]